MQQAFANLIAQFQNPNSAETQHAMRTLNTPNPNDIVTLINMRMQQQPPFFNSMGLFATATFEATERAFAATVPGLNPDLWVNFVTQIRAFVQQPQQQQPQQQYQQQQMQQQQMQQQMQQQQQPQQQQQQQQQQQYEAEPVLGPVPPMPNRITLQRAKDVQQSFYAGLFSMPRGVSESIGRNGGKKSRLRSNKRSGKRSRSNKRGHRRGHKKSMRKMRRKSMCKKRY